MSEVLILKKRKVFVRVAAKGVKVATSTLILQAAQSLSAPEGSCRTGYTTTKKIGKAHVRNRTRRRMRAAVRELFPARARPGVDYVLIGRYNTADCPFDKLKGDLCYGLKKLHKLLNPEEKKHEPATEKPVDLAD